MTAEQRRRIVYLFDYTHGDADYAAERCGIVGVRRAEVLAVVLAETRRKGPAPAPLALCARGAAA